MVLESENVDVVVDVLVSVLAAWAGRDRGAHKEWHFFGSIFSSWKNMGLKKSLTIEVNHPWLPGYARILIYVQKKQKLTIE